MSLSERIRPNQEAAPWVVDEVKKMEDRIKLLEEAYFATEAVRTIRDCWCNHDPDVWIRCTDCVCKIKRYHTAKANLDQTEEAKDDKP